VSDLTRESFPVRCSI